MRRRTQSVNDPDETVDVAEASGPGDDLQPVGGTAKQGSVWGAGCEVVDDLDLVRAELIKYGKGAVPADQDEGVVGMVLQLARDLAGQGRRHVEGVLDG